MKIEYHNLYTHLILVTKNRYPFIKEEFRARLEKYITRIVTNHNSRLYAIYANPEHVHMLISRAPSISEEQLCTRVAGASEKFLVESGLCESTFSWQDSASAFSVSKSDVDRVCKYIMNQKSHHQTTSFQQEYARFIKHYQKTLRWQSPADSSWVRELSCEYGDLQEAS